MSINKLKKKLKYPTTESMLDLIHPIPFQCTYIDHMKMDLEEINKVGKDIHNIDIIHDEEYRNGLEQDLIYHTEGLDEQLEEMRNNFIELRAWAEEWKRVAKLLSEYIPEEKLVEILEINVK